MSHPFEVNTGNGSLYWGNPVATPAFLPAIGLPGESRVVLDDGDSKTAIYTWNEIALSWEKVADPDSSGGSSDGRIKVSSNDLILDYISNQLTTSTAAVSITEVNDGADESLSIDVADATTSQSGLVELATDGESISGVVVQGNDSRLSDSRAPSGAASGDLADNYPNPTVTKIQNNDVLAGVPTDNQYLVWNSSNNRWEPTDFYNSKISLQLLTNTDYNDHYRELTYTGDNLTAVDIWETSGKLLKLFSRTLSYTGDNLTQVVTLDEINTVTLTTNLVYSGDALINITKTFS